MLSRSRVVVLVVLALMSTACGSVHPGDAAVVDGQSISMKTLNKTAKVYCTLTLPQAKQAGTSVSNSDIRRQAVTSLVTLVVARRIADDRGLKLNPGTYELAATQEQQIDKAFSGDEAEDVKKAIVDSQHISAIAIALGAASTGETRSETNAAALTEAGQKEIIASFKDYDVEFAPRFGLSSSAKAVSDTGSLSVAPVDLEAPTEDELPAPQRCA